MSLSNSQCIEVAEKVWGLSADDISKEYNTYLCDVEYQTNLSEEEWLINEVNSWQGFGRTVEAMENRGYKFEGNGADGFQFSNDEKCTAYEFGSEKLIKATHLAALEALK